MRELESLVVKFQETGDYQYFDKVYKMVLPKRNLLAARYTVVGATYEDKISKMDEYFMKYIAKYDPNKCKSFITYVCHWWDLSMGDLTKYHTRGKRDANVKLEPLDSVDTSKDYDFSLTEITQLFNQINLSEIEKNIAIYLSTGYRLSDISRILNIPDNQVYKIKSSLKKKLNKLYKFS